MLLTNYHAFFFDYDGVLANTMDYNFLAWMKAFKEVNTAIDRDLYFLQEGKSRKVVAKEQLERDGLDTAIAEQVAQRKDQIFRNNFANQVALYPNITNLLHYLKSLNKTLIVVTGASKERIESSIINKEIFPFFDHIITADDTLKGKPFPDPYLKALELSEKEASQCIVIENAPMGIQAAKDAGLRCVALCHTLKASQLEKADFILNNSSELFRTIVENKEDN